MKRKGQNTTKRRSEKRHLKRMRKLEARVWGSVAKLAYQLERLGLIERQT